MWSGAVGRRKGPTASPGSAPSCPLCSPLSLPALPPTPLPGPGAEQVCEISLVGSPRARQPVPPAWPLPVWAGPPPALQSASAPRLLLAPLAGGLSATPSPQGTRRVTSAAAGLLGCCEAGCGSGELASHPGITVTLPWRGGQAYPGHLHRRAAPTPSPGPRDSSPLPPCGSTAHCIDGPPRALGVPHGHPQTVAAAAPQCQGAWRVPTEPLFCDGHRLRCSRGLGATWSPPLPGDKDRTLAPACRPAPKTCPHRPAPPAAAWSPRDLRVLAGWPFGACPTHPQSRKTTGAQAGTPRASQRTQWWFQGKAAAVGATARTSMQTTVSFPHHGALGQIRRWGNSVMLVSSILAVTKSVGHGPQSPRAGEPRAWSSTDPHLSPGGRPAQCIWIAGSASVGKTERGPPCSWASVRAPAPRPWQRSVPKTFLVAATLWGSHVSRDQRTDTLLVFTQ